MYPEIYPPPILLRQPESTGFCTLFHGSFTVIAILSWVKTATSCGSDFVRDFTMMQSSSKSTSRGRMIFSKTTDNQYFLNLAHAANVARNLIYISLPNLLEPSLRQLRHVKCTCYDSFLVTRTRV